MYWRRLLWEPLIWRGLAIGYWKDIDELKEQWCLDKVFNPQMKEDTARKLLNEWHKAVGRSQNWLNNEIIL